MLTLDEAKLIVLRNRPKGTVIKSAIEYEGDYLFIAPGPDPLEGRFDPWFKVDPETGYFRDWSPQNYDKPVEVLTLLKAQMT